MPDIRRRARRGKLLGDAAAVTALLDRLLHHAHVQMWAAQLAHKSPDRLAHRGGDEVELYWLGHYVEIADLAVSIHARLSESIAGTPAMLRYTFIAAVVVLVGTMTVIARQKPDFSGEWQLNRQASMLSPIIAPVAQSGTLRIEHKEPRFKCHMTIVMDGKPLRRVSARLRASSRRRARVPTSSRSIVAQELLALLNV